VLPGKGTSELTPDLSCQKAYIKEHKRGRRVEAVLNSSNLAYISVDVNPANEKISLPAGKHYE
jgi:hypothetical protein